MKIGVIGTGNMGTIITESLIEGAVSIPENIYITNRTIEKTKELKKNYPSINVLKDSQSIAAQSDILFICVKPLQIEPLLRSMNEHLTEDQIIISITSPVTVTQLESIIKAKAARMIPSITNRALSGTTLITLGERCTEADQQLILEIAGGISTPIMIEEATTRVASDLSSCGPAFMCFLLEKMIDAAVSVTDITKEQATALATEMTIGFGRLLEKDYYTLETLKEKVHVKGGVTGVGLKVLEDHTEGLFEKLFKATQDKFKEDHEYVDEQFSEQVKE